MSKKIGIPILKGMPSGRYQRGEAHINITAAAREALMDEATGFRSCSDLDYKPARTQSNLCLTPVRTYQDAIKERERHIQAYYDQGGRKIRSDSPHGVVGIIKPDMEVMSQLSSGGQIRLLERALDKVLTKFHMTRENLIYAVVHLDEGNPHIHFETDGITRDKNGKIRWSVHDCFQLKTLSALNEQVPMELKKEFGYDLEVCERHAPGTRHKQILDKASYVVQKANKMKQEVNELEQETKELIQEKAILTNDIEVDRELARQAAESRDKEFIRLQEIEVKRAEDLIDAAAVSLNNVSFVGKFSTVYRQVTHFLSKVLHLGPEFEQKANQHTDDFVDHVLKREVRNISGLDFRDEER